MGFKKFITDLAARYKQFTEPSSNAASIPAGRKAGYEVGQAEGYEERYKRGYDEGFQRGVEAMAPLEAPAPLERSSAQPL
jgi:flagellar biosynthesis/type III secretory pathway protein FliH